MFVRTLPFVGFGSLIVSYISLSQFATAATTTTTSSTIPTAALSCRPPGPILPRPTNLQTSSTLLTALSNLTSLLDTATSSNSTSTSGNFSSGWASANTSFSIALVSLSQKNPGVPLWEYHHRASGNVNGTREINRDSQYLIGSVSKVFTDLALRKSGLRERRVVEFLPALADQGGDGKGRKVYGKVNWEEVTLGDLTEHLAGVPTNYGFSEYYYLQQVFLALGFPPIDVSSYPPCGIIGLNTGCNAEQFIAGLADSYATTALHERASYSTAAFNLVALAVKSATGKSYAEQIRDYISIPLGLTSTFPSPGNDSRGVIPPVDNSWGSQYGENDLEAPGGGLVSTLSDLSTLLYSILNRTALPPAAIRTWLAPRSFTGSPSTSIGGPWEIYRPSNLVPNHPHTVTITAKSGGAYGYRSQIGIIDEYGVGVVVLSAGDPDAAVYVYDAMLGVLVPAIDAAGAEEVGKSGLVGTFVSALDQGGDGGMINVNATLSYDGHSMVLESLYRNGSDIVSAITQLWSYTALGVTMGDITPPFRIFPTDETWRDENGTLQEMWRLWFTPDSPASSDLPGRGMSAGDCMSWTLNDWLYYGGEPLDRVVVSRNESGEVVGVEFPFLRAGVLSRM